MNITESEGELSDNLHNFMKLENRKKIVDQIDKLIETELKTKEILFKFYDVL
jgi:hypothetical protein